MAQRAFGFALNIPSAVSVPNSIITVYNNGTMTLSTIYSDNLSTPKSNPFLADVNGYWFFYAANGRYDVNINTGTVTYTLGDVDLNDIFTLNTLTNSTQTLVVGSSGTGFNIVASVSGGVGIQTFNLPDASATADGTINTGTQTIAGAKTFTTPIGPASGGTGINAGSAANGTLPIGNGSGFTLATLTGTANQVIVANASGSITLSLPQSIGTASSVTFGGILNSALASNQYGMMYVADALGTEAVLTPLMDGQLYIGETGAAPQAAYLTAGTNMTITQTPGTITLAAASGLTSLNGLTAASAPSQSFVIVSNSLTEVSSGSSHTFTLPDATTTQDGTVTTTSQSFAGQKTFLIPPNYYPGGTQTTALSVVSGLLYASTTTGSNVSTGETTLQTFTIPASLLLPGVVIRLTAYGTTASNTNSKTVKLYFGSVTNSGIIYTQTTAVSAVNWKVEGVITNVGTGSQFSVGSGVFAAIAGATLFESSAEVTSSSIVVKVTGTGGASSDITAYGFIVEAVGA
jgi:trimeric autotransporter adhesin